MNPGIFITITIAIFGGICMGAAIAFNINMPKRKLETPIEGAPTMVRVEYSEPFGAHGEVKVYDNRTGAMILYQVVWRLQK